MRNASHCLVFREHFEPAKLLTYSCFSKFFFLVLIFNNLSDNKRQQTVTVDYKRLLNGFVLTDDVSLWR